MIVTLSGITGTGKSFFKKKISENMKFENLVIITTRPKRDGEIDGIDKCFVTKEQFFKMKENKEIVADFMFLNEYYAYRTVNMESDKNQVTELHYEEIELFKKYAKDVFSIYILPYDFERPKIELKKRCLSSEVENQRIKEMQEQRLLFETNKQIQQQFDYIFYNDYTEEATKRLLDIIQERRNISEKKSNCWKLENEYASK